MTRGVPRPAPARADGFTLIELLAVLALFALIAGLILPRFTVGGARAVKREAEALGESVEFARQRAIMTGRPHRVVMDLDRGQHWIEWVPPPPPEREAVAAREAARAAGSRRIDMTPPPAASGELRFEPVPGFDRAHRIEDGVRLAAVAFPDVGFDSGIVSIEIGADGVTDPAVASFASDDQSAVFEVEVAALADSVQVVDARR
jgi:prepilin-type N-terminal cleavage/methylation domain-containing protein